MTRYHNPNYETTHRYESRMTLKNCRTCHSETQCRDCHKASGVAYKSSLLQKRHPLGWDKPLLVRVPRQESAAQPRFLHHLPHPERVPVLSLLFTQGLPAVLKKANEQLIMNNEQWM